MKYRKSSSSPIPRLLTVPEVAEALKVSERTIWRWIEAGEIEIHRVGRTVRIAEDESPG